MGVAEAPSSMFCCGREASRTATAVVPAHGVVAVCNITSETIDCEREAKERGGGGGRESFYRNSLQRVKTRAVRDGGGARVFYEVVVGGGGGGSRFKLHRELIGRV